MPDNPLISTDAPRGATVQSYYARRNMSFYPVAEHELESLSLMNTLNSALLTVSVGLITLAIGIWVSAAFSDKLTPAGAVMQDFAAPILMVLGFVVLYFCRWTRSKRDAVWKKIVSASESGPAME